MVTGTVNYGYDSDLRVSRLSYAGMTLTVSYDADSLLTGVGSWAVHAAVMAHREGV